MYCQGSTYCQPVSTFGRCTASVAVLYCHRIGKNWHLCGRVCFGLMNPSFEIFYKNIVPYMTTDLLMEKMSWAIFYNDLAPLQNELYSLVISQATIGVVYFSKLFNT